MIKTLSLISVALIATSFISIAQGQIVSDALSEDQVIVCVNGHIVEMSGNICKVFMSDIDHDKPITELQEQIYKDPNSDTFEMDVRD